MELGKTTASVSNYRVNIGYYIGLCYNWIIIILQKYTFRIFLEFWTVRWRSCIAAFPAGIADQYSVEAGAHRRVIGLSIEKPLRTHYLPFNWEDIEDTLNFPQTSWNSNHRISKLRLQDFAIWSWKILPQTWIRGGMTVRWLAIRIDRVARRSEGTQ